MSLINKKQTYLMFDLVILTLPILASMFYEKFVWFDFWPALGAILGAWVVFGLHDQWVSDKWWFFNEKFVINKRIGKLPVEEILFFPVVAFACLLIWANLKQGGELMRQIEVGGSFVFGLACVFLLMAWFFGKKKMFYTSFVMGGQVFLWGLDVLLRTFVFRSLLFYVFLLGGVLLTLVFNSFLTSREVVIYPKKYKTEIRIATIPIEDFVYGMNFLGLVVLIYEYLIGVGMR